MSAKESEMQNNILELEAKLDSSQSTIKDLELAVRSKETEIAAHENASKELKEKMDESLSTLSQELEAARQRNEELIHEKRRSEDLVQDAQKEITK
jgi:chromosome segregation ATPase